jgi:hypothetical protein
MTTVIPATLAPMTSHSPVCTPARTSMPNDRTAEVIASAQRTARSGVWKTAKNPSPAVSISRPS